jgi:chromosomal replication initiation ATPase DnaA
MNCEPCINHGLIGIKLRQLRKVHIDVLVSSACMYLGMEEDLITGKHRNRDRVENRHLIMVYLSRERNIQLSQIARKFNRDHTSVIHARKNVDALCFSEPNFKDKYEQLKQYLDQI